MRNPSNVLGATIKAAVFFLASAAGAAGAVDVLSYHGNNTLSNGVNASETLTTTASVGAFEKQFTTTITDVPNVTGIPSSTLPSSINYTAAAGQVYAEPLVKTGVNITTGSSQGLHDVVFVATSMNSLYAIDAAVGTILWKDSFLYNASGNPNPLNAAIPAGVTACPGGYGTETNSQDVSPWIGIVSTPVIDGTNGYLYVVVKTREARSGDQTHPHYVHTLHKVRLSDGLDASVVIADTTLQSSTTFTFNSGPYVAGTASDAITVSGQTRVYFNAVRQMIRPALQLYNGRIYIASASHGDNQPYHGWVLTYDASTLTLNGVLNTTPNGVEGGVWEGGDGVVIDANGYIYIQTGNGTFEGTNTGNVVAGLDASGFPSKGNYGDCFVKLALDPTTTQGNQQTNKNGWGLKVVDYFSPYNNQALSSSDDDLGSGGPTILPDSAGSAAHPHLLVGTGKEGKVYLLDRDNMGKFGIADNAVQTVSGAVNGCFSTPAYFNGRLYTSSGFGGTMVSYLLGNATIATGSLQNTPDQISFPGCSPYISANGTASGVVWVVDRSSGQLRAYDAANLSTKLWSSNTNAARDALGTAVKFSVATPANGRVYVGTADKLVVYGPPVPPTSAPAAPSALTLASITPSTITLSWTDNSTNEAGFKVERSGNGTTFTEVASVGAGVVTYVDSGLSSQAAYYYRVRAYNSFNTISYSNYSNMVNGVTPSLNSQTPVDLYHFDAGSGTSAIDSVGTNHGALIGSPLPGWVTPGRVGSSHLSFSGNGAAIQNGQSCVQLTSDLAPILGSTSSLLFWVKTTQVGVANAYQSPAVTGVEQATKANDIGWGVLNAAGRMGMAVGNGIALSTNPINDGAWHHFALSRDSNTGVVKIYVDGVLNSTTTLETGAKTSQFKIIGALSDVQADGTTFSGANFFNGQLDDVQIYNLVIDPAVVAAIALPPAAPTNLKVTPFSGTELDLSWTDNATNESAYRVFCSVNGGAWTVVASLAANATSYAHTGLTPNTTYSYFVEASNSAGYSDSSTVSVVTPVPPITPSNATVTYLAPTEVDLAWIDNGANETGYRILRKDTGSFTQIASLPANSTSYQDLTVQPGVGYDYHIQAYNIAGYSDFAGLTITTPAQSQYLTYLGGYGLTSPADTSTTADVDRDGLSNLLEYAFNTNPTQPDTVGLPVWSVVNGYLTISFTARIPPTDLRYVVEVSDDMVSWRSGAPNTVQVSVTPIDASTQQITVRDTVLSTSSRQRYIRVNVTH